MLKGFRYNNVDHDLYLRPVFKELFEGAQETTRVLVEYARRVDYEQRARRNDGYRYR